MEDTVTSSIHELDLSAKARQAVWDTQQDRHQRLSRQSSQLVDCTTSHATIAELGVPDLLHVKLNEDYLLSTLPGWRETLGLKVDVLPIR
jgi:hypothetical protein